MFYIFIFSCNILTLYTPDDAFLIRNQLYLAIIIIHPDKHLFVYLFIYFYIYITASVRMMVNIKICQLILSLDNAFG
jgi:hypothetical protein